MIVLCGFLSVQMIDVLTSPIPSHGGELVAARTTGLAATGVTAATYPLVLSTVPRIYAPVIAVGSSTTNVAASAVAAARLARSQRATSPSPRPGEGSPEPGLTACRT